MKRLGQIRSGLGAPLAVVLRWPLLAAVFALVLLVAACQPQADQNSSDSKIQDSGEKPTEPTTEVELKATGEPGAESSLAGSVPAPEFPLGLDWLNTEQPLSLGQLRGKLVLLDFWTYGCINCMHIIPDLEKLEAEFPNELVVIGVHSAKFENEGETENIRQIILRYGLEHPVVNDRDFLIWRIWGARAWPTLALIDPAGNVVGVHAGEGVYPIFQPVIAALVREFERSGELDRTPLNLKLEKEGLSSTVLAYPGKLLADPLGGRLFIADTHHNRIVVAQLDSGRVLAVYGSGAPGLLDGAAGSAAFWNPQGLALSADGQTLYVADTDNHAIRTIDLPGGQVSTLVGTGEQAWNYPPRSGLAPHVELNSPWDLELDGDVLYIAMAGSHQIWSMNLRSGKVEPLAGSGYEGTQDGASESATLAQPSGLALDGKGRLYFADSESSTIRWVDLAGQNPEVGTLVGSGATLFEFGDVDGIGREARLQHPLGVASDGNRLFVADTYNSKIKLIDPATQRISTFLGRGHGWRDGLEPLFYEPGGLDLADGVLYVADTNNHAVRVVDLENGETRTLVISGIEAFQVISEGGAFGTTVDLPAAAMVPGEGLIRLDIRMPEGYKVNALAPSSFEWSQEGGVIEQPSSANVSVMGPQFPMEFEVSFRNGQGRLIGDLTIYYCEQESESLCLIEQVQLRVPILVDAQGENTLKLEYSIPAPNLGSNEADASG